MTGDSGDACTRARTNGRCAAHYLTLRDARRALRRSVEQARQVTPRGTGCGSHGAVDRIATAAIRAINATEATEAIDAIEVIDAPAEHIGPVLRRDRHRTDNGRAVEGQRRHTRAA